MSAADGPIPTVATGAGASAMSLLARQPVVVLGGLCGVALLFIGWAAVRSPLPTLIGVAVWAVLLFSLPLYRKMRRTFAAAPKVEEKAQAALRKTAVAAPAWTNPTMAFIGPDLVMEGCLTGPGEVEVFGSLSGAVLCDSVRVHPGGVVRASVVYRRFTVAKDATFEGAAQPMPVTHRGGIGIAQPLPPVTEPVQRRGATG